MENTCNRVLFSKMLMACFFMFFLLSNGNAKSRIVENFNFGWKFHWGNFENAQKNESDDSNWRNIDLPHDFQIEQPWDKSAGGARGFKATSEGWYRKTFKADSSWKGKRILLDFEGIMLFGDAYLNGMKIGGTDYGYLGFEADITKYINYEGDNVVAVYASTKGNSRWYTGGGLYRDVHLVLKDTIAVARHGVFITTPGISEQNAEINVQVEVEGMRGKSNNVTILAKIMAPDGKQVAVTEIAVPQKRKSETVEVLLPVVNIATPRLWSCETPDLYTAEISLVSEGKELDLVTETFGIRTLEYSNEFGFKLNGKKIFLNGIANHHDLGAVGAAAHEFAIERQFKRLKEFGYNHIRTSHNPYSKSFLRLADKYGILITDEIYDKWSNKDYWAGRMPWTDLWYKNIPEWIKRDRNHPSIIMWSLGNELQMREDFCGFPTGDWGVTSYRILDTLTKRYDPTRKTTVAMFPARANAVVKNDAGFNTKILPPELATVTEIASFNYRWTDYQEYLKHAPHMIMYQSEAATYELAQPFFGMDYDKMVGLAYWGAIEYWGESNSWPKKGWNYSFFNHALEPFPQAYLIKSIFSEDPVVHIGVVDKEAESLEWNDVVVGRMPISSHWNRKEGSKQNLFTYTNAEEVELFVNGKSIGVQKNSTEINKRNMIYWKDVPYQSGKIIAVAHTGGKEVARHQLETTGKAVALKVELENNYWKAGGMDLQYAKVYAVDNKGRIVPTAEEVEITFDISGAASLIAVDNGDHYSDELFAGNKRRLYNGFALAILRSGQTAGNAVLKVSGEGYRTAKINLTVH